MKKNIQVSDVMKKDLRVVGFLTIFGVVTVLSARYLQTGEFSVIFGAVANYIAFRVEQELKKEGYTQALKK